MCFCFCFCAFFLVEGGENWIIKGGNKGGEPDGAAKVGGTALGHMILVSREVARLSNGRIDTRIRDKFFRRGEAGDVADFAKSLFRIF